MEARPFIRVSVGALGLRIPQASRSAGAGVHSSSSPCFCEIRLPNFPAQTASVPLLASTPTPTTQQEPDLHNVAASFHLDEPALQKLLSPAWLPPLLGRRASACASSRSRRWLEIVVFTGRQGSCCGVRRGKQLGSFRVAVDRAWAEGKSEQLHSGWVAIGGRGGGSSKGQGGEGGPGAELHLVVRVEPDPWYVFQFDGAPSLSPKIVQAQGNSRQPIFSCKFSRCSGLDHSCSDTSSSTSMNCWPAGSGGGGGAHALKDQERKGWTVTIHDLSGSTLAAASMITPFVPSAGTSRVSKSNPGAWLIMRPDGLGHGDSWTPWGQLEAWRERGRKAGVGCRFQLLPPTTGLLAAAGGATNPGILITETVLSKQSGAEFRIDTSRLCSSSNPPGGTTTTTPAASPGGSPKSSGDYAFLNLQGHLPVPVVGGFVMSCNVQADGGGGSSGRRRRRKPVVQLATRHVSTVEDAAIFMALAAAVDLSADICLSSLNKKKKSKSHGLGATTR